MPDTQDSKAIGKETLLSIAEESSYNQRRDFDAGEEGGKDPD